MDGREVTPNGICHFKFSFFNPFLMKGDQILEGSQAGFPGGGKI